MSTARRATAALLSAGVATALVTAIFDRRAPDTNLAEHVRTTLPASGVEHPVTAVLLQFRSYDTLLEIAVLLVAAVIALALREEQAPRGSQPNPSAATRTPLLASAVRLLMPVMIVTAVYLLWAGAFQPGGAFQAGAVLAALGVVWRVSGRRLPDTLLTRWRHALLIAGFATFLALATAMLLLGRPLLAWPPSHAKYVIVAIESVLMVSIGAGLLALFMHTPDAPAIAAPPTRESV